MNGIEAVGAIDKAITRLAQYLDVIPEDQTSGQEACEYAKAIETLAKTRAMLIQQGRFVGVDMEK